MIEKIKPQTVLKIDGREYTTVGMALYETRSTKSQYWKIFFNHHKVLVVSKDEDFFMFGEQVETLPYNQPFPSVILYNGIKYKKETEDFQTVMGICFGNKDDIEGNCEFCDYAAENNLYISIGTLSKNAERADVFGRVLQSNDVTVL